MTEPTAADIIAKSKVDFPALGYADEVELQPKVDQAKAYIIQVTGRVWATMPSHLEPIAFQATQIRTEQVAFQSQEDYQESAADDVVGSFSAGGYSETRHDPNRRGESKSINSNPSLAELLWILLTTTPAYPDPNVDVMYDFWRQLLGGVNAPAFGVTEVDWSGSASMPRFGVLEDRSWQRLP